jgi:hypothetical protein
MRHTCLSICRAELIRSLSLSIQPISILGNSTSLTPFIKCFTLQNTRDRLAFTAERNHCKMQWPQNTHLRGGVQATVRTVALFVLLARDVASQLTRQPFSHPSQAPTSPRSVLR